MILAQGLWGPQIHSPELCGSGNTANKMFDECCEWACVRRLSQTRELATGREPHKMEHLCAEAAWSPAPCARAWTAPPQHVHRRKQRPKISNCSDFPHETISTSAHDAATEVHQEAMVRPRTENVPGHETQAGIAGMEVGCAKPAKETLGPGHTPGATTVYWAYSTRKTDPQGRVGSGHPPGLRPKRGCPRHGPGQQWPLLLPTKTFAPFLFRATHTFGSSGYQ